MNEANIYIHLQHNVALYLLILESCDSTICSVNITALGVSLGWCSNAFTLTKNNLFL
jgi:hypothetical protein